MLQRIVPIPIAALLLLGLALSVAAGNPAPATDDRESLLPSASTYQSKTEYHGNTDSKIFHKSSCRYYNCKSCTKVFKTRSEAIEAGYRACKVCKP